jgi:hypothetical protein
MLGLNILYRIKGQLDIEEQKSVDLQRKSRLFQNEAQRGKRMKSNEHTISDL